jgi:hypothetical protein
MKKHLLVASLLISVSLSIGTVAFSFNGNTRSPSGAASSVSCPAAWSIVSSPNVGSGNNELYGIDAASANDIWTVGRYSDPSGYKTLALHWDGDVWNVVPTPNVGSAFNQIFSVAAVSSNNVWAVGASSNNNVLNQTLIEHWDGNQWSVVASPLAPGTSSFLYGIVAIGANDIWAVGYIQIGFSAQQPLTLHWDGSSWSLVLSPSTAPNNQDILWSVTALATNNIWAVGYSTDAVSGQYRTLIEHWNGTAWSIVTSPNPTGSIYNFTWGIEAVSPNDVWVMGRAYDGSLYPSLIEHWDGSAWSVTPSPSEQFYNEVYDASAVSSTDVWAVGRYGGGFSDNIAMVMHWNGSAWSVVPNPNPPGATENNFLYSVHAVAAQDVWAVGSYFKDQKFQTLIERYSTVPCLTATAAVSRKTHGTAGNFDINLPPTGNPGVECRAGGANSDYQVVFTFAAPVTSAAATVTAGSGGTATVSGAPIIIGNNVAVNLTGVSNAQKIVVSVNVTDGTITNDVAVSMNVLAGDTNADGFVNSADIGQTKSQSGNAVTNSNFREDVSADGFLNSADISLVKSKSGTALP